MKYRVITREEFLSVERNKQHDKFAGTFVAKADAMNLWDDAVGAIDEETGELMGAMIIRISKRKPKVANLQLLHTFYKHRRKGVASFLVTNGYKNVVAPLALLFRVSSEPEALPFYRSLGLRFWGEQKSGSLLCMHAVDKITGNMKDGIYSLEIKAINTAINSKMRGGVIKLFDEPK
jgi:hypothetical protein